MPSTKYRLLCLSGAVTIGALSSTLVATPAFADGVPTPVGTLVPAPVAKAIAGVPVPALPSVPLPSATPLPVPLPGTPPGVPAPTAPGTPPAPTTPVVSGSPAPKTPVVSGSTAPKTPVTTGHRTTSPKTLPKTSSHLSTPASGTTTLRARTTAGAPAAVAGLHVASLPALGTGTRVPAQAALALPELAGAPQLAGFAPALAGSAPALAGSAPLLAPVITPQLAPGAALAGPRGLGHSSLPLPIVTVAAVAAAGAASTQLAQMRARRVRV